MLLFVVGQAGYRSPKRESFGVTYGELLRVTPEPTKGVRLFPRPPHALAPGPPRCCSHPLEIGAFGDRQALEVAAQAVEAELDRTQAHPVAAAIDARAAGFDALFVQT
jgi:hypothetical protein